MSVNYYALGKTSWQAILLEDFQGARGPQLGSLDEIGDVILHTDDIYEQVCETVFGEYRPVYWPRPLLELFMRRFGEENPHGVEYWASDCVSVYDEPKEGSFGWLKGNHGHPIEYLYFRNMWGIADRYIPELRQVDNMKEIFGAAYEPYSRALASQPEETHEAASEGHKSFIGFLRNLFGMRS